LAGWVLGQPETEEAQNRIIALKNKAVVVSVDYRKSECIYCLPSSFQADPIQSSRIPLPYPTQ
jgi:hypothetical protein